MEKFSQSTRESLGYYVYALIDPRDNKIFYVGKGVGDRVFAHVQCAINDDAETDKLDTIREIIKAEKEVKHYILRHKLTEHEAYIVESAFIDFLTHSDFDFVANITNIVAGHHQWNEGIKTAEELEILYACKPLFPEEIQHKIMSININKTYALKNEMHPNIYEATRKSWVVSEHRIKDIDFVFSEYRGIVRAIFKPSKWISEGKRWMFEGEEVKDHGILDLYLNKSVPDKSKGMANPIKYFYPVTY
jgi:hypothetical protein